MSDPMLTLARDAQKKSYAPYSNFHVGVCIKSASGKLYSGCNVENASYGLTQCAEGSAISMMVINGERNITDVMIVGDGDLFCTPCGACRQRLHEFSDADMTVTIVNTKGDTVSYQLSELLPHPFGSQVERN